MCNSERPIHTFTSCIVPDGGYLTTDGYLRVLSKPRKEGGKLKMLHRVEWEKINGPIPDGYEVDHKCKNRQCQNINHMQLLTRSEHKSKDNAQRYLLRTIEILKWIKSNPEQSQQAAANRFGVTQSTISRILKRHSQIH